jgi:hypothetical protein
MHATIWADDGFADGLDPEIDGAMRGRYNATVEGSVYAGVYRGRMASSRSFPAIGQRHGS